jgi:nucleotide sugar dehydrogenase
MNSRVIKNKYESFKVKTVCIQGLGFVGAAMATAVALATDDEGNHLYNVIGVDLSNDLGLHRVNSINKGEFPFNTSDEKLTASLQQAHRQGNIKATTDPAVYSKADIVVVDIQLDIPYLDDQPQLEFDGFRSAIRTLGRHVDSGTLILVETTVPPGTCESIVVPALNTELKKRGIDPKSIYIAHSYERVMPGENYLASIIDYWRVFAGHTKKAGDICESFLGSVVNVDEFPLTRLSSTVASETAKVMENTYRATNIAFIDEWTKYAESVGIDLFEVINAIRKRPTHSNIRFPGLGVGGYCLTKDPTFAPAAAKQLFGKELHFPFSRMAVRVNHDMPLHTVTRLKSLMSGSLDGKKLLVCGVSYRQDVGDTRYSPTEVLVRELIAQKANVTCHDPYVSYWEELNMVLPVELPKSQDFDAIIFATPHQLYRDLDLASWGNKNTLILDANWVFNSKQRELSRTCGIRIESIGRGDGL